MHPFLDEAYLDEAYPQQAVLGVLLEEEEGVHLASESLNPGEDHP